MEYLIVFIFGSVIGSFLNVCIYRLPRNLSLFHPGSRCSVCGQPIAWFDNVPLVSFLFLRGQCRHCRAFFSPRYLFVEFLTAALLVLCFHQLVASSGLYPRGGEFAIAFLFLVNHPSFVGLFLIGSLFLAALIVATFIDFDFQIIPDSISLGGLAVAVAVSLIQPRWHAANDFLLDDIILKGRNALLGEAWALEPHLKGLAGTGYPFVRTLLSCLLGAAIGAGIVWLVGFFGKIVFRKDAMGFGDVKFNAMIGAFLGWKVAVGTLVLGAFLGAVAGIVVLIRTRNSRMPFGPYLSAAAGLQFLFYDFFSRLPGLWHHWVQSVLFS